MTNEEKARRIMEGIDSSLYSIPWDYEELLIKNIVRTLQEIEWEELVAAIDNKCT